MADFFENQERARRRTGLLVVLFVAAVILIIAAAYLVVTLALFGIGAFSGDAEIQWWSPQLLAAVGGGVTLTVLFGSLYRLVQLRSGGQAIAAQLGGRYIDPSTTDPDQRKVLNVVQEMAIASGVPVPPVYLMESEGGINAFAAGYQPDDAVIGVTRGAIEQLSRDELQGVIAHEFSHILNGDMRLNIRLMGVLYGILVIALVGQGVLRTVLHSGGRSRRRGKGGGGQAILVGLAIGLGLMAVGYIGLLVGKLIKAAVSRQREYLADAAAVQFTRNPEGIGGALQKIGGYATGAQLVATNAEEASHMLFGQGVGLSFGGLLATHPPLPRRIKAVWPQWDGTFTSIKPSPRKQQRRAEQQEPAAGDSMADRIRRAREAAKGRPGAALMEQIGSPTPAGLAYAAALAEALDPQVKQSAQAAFGARAVCYALLLDADEAVRRRQLDALQRSADPAVLEELRRIDERVRAMGRAQRLMLLDTLAPVLRQMSRPQWQGMRANLDVLIDADEKVSLFEWSLRRVLVSHMERALGDARPVRVRYYSLRGVQQELAVVLSTVAYAGHEDRAEALRAFEAAAREVDAPLQPCEPEQCGLAELDAALDVLQTAAPRLRRDVVRAVAACIATDRELTAAESELFRAVAATLDVPVPPTPPGELTSAQ